MEALVGGAVFDNHSFIAGQLLPREKVLATSDPPGHPAGFVHRVEIALMMCARRMLQEEPADKEPRTERLKLIERRWRINPIMAAESYPDECWTFDHGVSLAASKVADRLDGTRHRSLLQRETARDFTSETKRGNS
jgi:hypothetical protein